MFGDEAPYTHTHTHIHTHTRGQTDTHTYTHIHVHVPGYDICTVSSIQLTAAKVAAPTLKSLVVTRSKIQDSSPPHMLTSVELLLTVNTGLKSVSRNSLKLV